MDDPIAAAPANIQPFSQTPLCEQNGGGRRCISILIVDDDAALRLTINRMLALSAAYNFRVECAEDGAHAILAIQSHVPDLIITDIYMPAADGFELLNWLRASALDVPVLAMSGSGSTSSSYYDPLRLAQKLGAVAIIDKPFRAPQLTEVIDTILANRSNTTVQYR